MDKRWGKWRPVGMYTTHCCGSVQPLDEDYCRICGCTL